MRKTRNHPLFSAVLNAMPSPVFIVDEDVKIIEANEAARPLLGEDANTIYLRRGGEALHCLNATGAAAGCGQSPNCATCVIRTSVGESFANRKVVRRATRMILTQKDESREAYLLITTAPLVFEGHHYVILTIEDINELVELRRLIPICANCKKIRNEQEYWDNLETYFKTHLDMDFTHGICPECITRLYPGLAADKPLGK